MKEVGLVEAVGMIPRYFTARLRNRILLAGGKRGKKDVECPCCGWRGPGFGTYWDPSETIPGFECPACSSHPRHRYMALHLRDWVPMERGWILHFAPEPSLDPVFRRMDGSDPRITTDYAMAGVDFLSNITALPFGDGAFAGILCSHVLEHIEEDREAMKELFRVLAPGGTAVICIPERDMPETVEFGFPDPRKTHHWRDYGRDVADRLREAGFRVETVNPAPDDPDTARHGLAVQDRVHLCTKAG